MRSILKLLRGNLKQGRGSFKGIILLMAILTFSFSGTISNNDQLEKAQKQRWENADMGDFLVYINHDSFTDEMKKSIRNAPSAAGSRVKETILMADSVRSDGEASETKIELIPFDPVYNVFDENGKDFVSNPSIQDGEILLTYKLHLFSEFQIGSKVTLHTHDGWDEDFVVKGYFEDHILGGATALDNRCMISGNDFARLKEEKLDHVDSNVKLMILTDVVEIYAKEGATADDLRKELSSTSGLIRTANAAVAGEYLKEAGAMYSSIGSKFVYVFVAMLILVILITMNNSIHSSIEMEYTELGILKSQGFTSWNIRMVYVIQYTLALLIGAVLGLLISIPALHFLIGAWTNISGIVSETGVSFGKCGLACVGVIVICFFFVLFATRKVSAIAPVVAINGGHEDVYFENRLKTRIRPKPLTLSIAWRQIISSLRSYIGTSLIVMLMVFFLIFSSVLTQGMKPKALFPELEGEIAVTNYGGLKLDKLADFEQEVRAIDADAQVKSQTDFRMEIDGELINILTFHSQEPVYRPLEGRIPQYENEVMVASGLSRILNKKIGDSITIASATRTEEYVITGYFDSVSNFGKMAIVTEQGMMRLGHNEVDVAYISLGDAGNKDAVISHLNSAYGDSLRAKEYEENRTMAIVKNVILVVMNAFSYAIYAILFIFSAVIVGMVCKRSFIKERKDIGVCKAMGFTAGELRRQFAMRFSIVALIGSAAGGVLALFLSDPLLKVIFSVVGITDFTKKYSVFTVLIPVIAICASFYICAYFSSRKVKNVEVRELITE